MIQPFNPKFSRDYSRAPSPSQPSHAGQDRGSEGGGDRGPAASVDWLSQENLRHQQELRHVAHSPLSQGNTKIGGRSLELETNLREKIEVI